MTLNHNPHNGILPIPNLLRQRGRHLRLIAMILLTIPMTAVHHQSRGQILRLELLLRLLNGLGIVIRAFGPSP